MRSFARIVMGVALVFAVGGWQVQAQPPGFMTKLLLKTTYSDDASKDALILSAELAPRATTGRHRHPGDEYGTVLEGEIELRVDGQEPRRIKAGQSYHNARGIVHESRNPGDKTAKLLSTFIIEKGQSPVQPVQ